MDKASAENIRFLTASLILVIAIVFKTAWSPGEPVPLKKSLDSFPLEIGPWQGKSASLGDNILDVLHVTDYLTKIYLPVASQRYSLPINLYVGYYQSQGKGKTYHSPRNCLPGSGWEFTSATYLPVDFQGESYKINKVVIQKGPKRQLLLYWYHDRGRIIAGEYWAKFYLVYDSIIKRRSDGALVRIIAPIKDSIDKTLAEEIAFINAMLPLLREHLPD